MEQLDIALRLGVAAVGGLAVGIEREWSAKTEGNRGRFAGVRTFLLIGILGCTGVLLILLGSAAGGGIVLGSAAMLIVTAYVSSAFQGDIDSTTEFAGIVVLASGALAGFGHLAIASALNFFTAFILAEKSHIHAVVYKMRSEELTAGLRFAVLALVVLPLLPPGPYGPEPGIRPRELWTLFLLFSGISFAGYIARRYAGQNRGYLLTGLLGGLISSTAVTLNFSRESRTQPEAGKALARGVVAACTVLPLRVLLIISILNFRVGIAAIPYLLATFGAGVVLIVLGRGNGEQKNTLTMPDNPLRIGAAIQMVAAFILVLYAVKWVTGHFGDAGFFVSAGMVGLTDVDALTFMVAKQQTTAPVLAGQALAIGIIANTILKLAISLVIGKGRFRFLTAVSLALMAAVTAAALLFSFWK